ncbi:tripartite tricarboxylate transporter TctB family protein [Seohaeicola saemankumensis]|uniref:tripartite tricarboxylate transporter TctB family protein n=1 Tax=Seohaeicola saemankumensis TaxID=481181 RepID=UPI0035D0E7EA
MSEKTIADRGARARLDFVSGVILALLSAAALLWLIPEFVPGEASRGEVSPKFFPNLSATVVLVCAIGLMLTNLQTFRLPSGGAARAVGLQLTVWIVIATVIFLLLANVGFLAAAAFSVIAGVAVARYRRRLWLVLLLAVGLPAFLDWGVWTLFFIELP